MRLRTKFILLVVLLHATLLVLSFMVWRSTPLVFILSEAVLVGSLAISWSLYRQLIRPLRMLMEGIEAIRDKDFTVKFRPTGKYEMDQLIDVYNRMIDELRAERTRQEEQHFFLDRLIQTSPTGIIILDFDGRVQQVNPAAAPLLSEELFAFLRALPTGGSRVVKLHGVHTYKLQKSQFMDRGFPRQFVMIEELTAELLAAEKDTYGKVIRMMAHEVNNTIGPVNSIIQTVSAGHPLPPPLHEALTAAFQRNQHLNHFVRNFAELVKLPPPVLQPVDLHLIAVSVAQLMSSQFPVTLTLSPGSFMVSADVLQMEQALVNIVKNAIEAIDGSGAVNISSSGRCLVVTDNGRGIPADAPLFTPFYSTKKDGQGIGLTLVREILVQHGCEFSLLTSEGVTRFTIQFPD
ncbi:sensor histidine kinase [Dinghuibacter silviterrae]|uniref:histidine kinase n=1 Tax=Dinghuibacter silviterrae TaxID=1539049 RepID=A0A4R8DTU3_9BACT|nr:ATP-binding protein [Dinghuibacter silviterrae]TDX00551.1 HAMP domain-containing protein [Dinghuibacter silviterrae]